MVKSQGLSSLRPDKSVALFKAEISFVKLILVEFENAFRIGIVAQHRRVAGDGKDIANVQRMRSHQFGLVASNVAVAATHVENNVDTGLSSRMMWDNASGDILARAERTIGDIDTNRRHRLCTGALLARVSRYSHREEDRSRPKRKLVRCQLFKKGFMHDQFDIDFRFTVNGSYGNGFDPVFRGQSIFRRPHWRSL